MSKVARGLHICTQCPESQFECFLLQADLVYYYVNMPTIVGSVVFWAAIIFVHFSSACSCCRKLHLHCNEFMFRCFGFCLPEVNFCVFRLSEQAQKALETVGSSYSKQISFRDAWAFIGRPQISGYSPFEEVFFSVFDLNV